VLRDVGDTSWHDHYLTKYFRVTPTARIVHGAFAREKSATVRHVLEDTSSNDYPAPYMMRLAANSVLTHRFAETLRSQGWGDAHLYHFASGILDGFRQFMEEAFGWGDLYAAGGMAVVQDGQIKRFGVHGKYPTKPESGSRTSYVQIVREVLRETDDTLLSRAATVRQRAIQVIGNHLTGQFSNGDDDGICTLLNAEELLLCAGLEMKLGLPAIELSKVEIRDALDDRIAGDWPTVVDGDT
jgi:hypothetical protein